MSSDVTDTIVLDETPPPSPTLTCTTFTDAVWSNYAGSTTCTITDTATPSIKTAVAYSTNSGSSWTDNSNNLSFSFTPTANTITKVLMRISDTGGGPTNSNTYTIKKDTTNPIGTVVQSPLSGSRTSGDVTLSIQATDAHAGLRSITYPDGKRVQLPATPTMIDPTTRVVGSSNSQPGFSANGQAGENQIIEKDTPRGSS